MKNLIFFTFLFILSSSVFGAQVNLQWQDNSNNEDGFKIEKSIDGVSFTEIDTTGTDQSTYIDTNVVSSVTYYYRVRAYNSAGNSAYSNTASATITSEDGVINAVAGAGFHSQNIGVQNKQFEIKFKASVSNPNIDASIGLSNIPVTTYGQLSNSVRFNNAGFIDARNNDVFSASQSYAYTINTDYFFRLIVDLSAQKYSVFVATSDGSETLIGENFAFRATAGNPNSLDTLNVITDSLSSGITTVSEISVNTLVTVPLPPTGLAIEEL